MSEFPGDAGGESATPRQNTGNFPPIDFEPPVVSGQPQSVFGQWTAVPAAAPTMQPTTPPYLPPSQGAGGPVGPPGSPGAHYGYPTAAPAPVRRNKGAAAAIWLLIAVVAVAAVVKLVSTPSPSPAPPAPPTTAWTPEPSSRPTSYPTNTATQGTSGLPTAGVSAPPAPTGNFGGFCIAYFVFSIDVTAGWDSYTTALAQNQIAPALTLVEQFSSDAQSVQGADPPVYLQADVDSVASDLAQSVDALRTGFVSGLPTTVDVFNNIQNLQAGADAYCNQ